MMSLNTRSAKIHNKLPVYKHDTLFSIVSDIILIRKILMFIKKTPGKIIIILFCSLFLLQRIQAVEKTQYTFARAPQLSSITLYNEWSPFTQHLSRELGIKIKLKLYKNRKAFLDDVYNGRPDFVYMNPYYTINAHARQGYKPVIRDGKQKLSGILVVPAKSGIKNIKQLQGAEIAFPSPNALAASLYMRALLDRKYNITFTPRYVGSHDNSYLHVILNKVKAGGGVIRTFESLDPEKRNRLRVLYKTPDINPHPVSVHPSVPVNIAKKFTQAILELNKTKNGRAILENIHISQPVRTSIKDYKAIKELNLEKYSIKK